MGGPAAGGGAALVGVGWSELVGGTAVAGGAILV